MPEAEELRGDEAGRELDVVLDGERSGSGRATERRLVQGRRRLSLDALPLDSVCGAAWSEWQLVCELELSHHGCHVGINERTGKIGCWGGGSAAYVARIQLLPEPETDPRAV